MLLSSPVIVCPFHYDRCQTAHILINTSSCFQSKTHTSTTNLLSSSNVLTNSDLSNKLSKVIENYFHITKMTSSLMTSFFSTCWGVVPLPWRRLVYSLYSSTTPTSPLVFNTPNLPLFYDEPSVGSGNSIDKY